MRSHKVLPLALLLMCLLEGCVSDATRVARAQQKERAAALKLAARDDADSLAAASLLSFGDQEMALTLIDRAVNAAPERPYLAWLQIEVCGKVTGCDPRAAEKHLQLIDSSIEWTLGSESASEPWGIPRSC